MITRREITAALATAGIYDIDKLGASSEASQRVFKDLDVRSIVFGSAIRTGPLIADNQYRILNQRLVKIATPEGELKWNALAPNADNYDFSRVEAIPKLLHLSGRCIRGHTLIWHNAIPQWALEKIYDRDHSVVSSHICKVIESLKHLVGVWDVVNEAIDPGQPGSYRRSAFYKSFGPSYVNDCFFQAARADPTATLVYNDYGFEASTYHSTKKREALINLLHNFKSEDVPVHAIGLQTHLRLQDNFPSDDYEAFVREIARLGYKIHITELDVFEGETNSVSDRDKKVAERVSDVLQRAIKTGAVTHVSTWGLTDRYTWLNEWGAIARRDLSPVRALPFDHNFDAKPFLRVLQRLVSSAPRA